MSRNEVVLRFDAVDFQYEPNKPILDEVSFSVRRNSKITVMGQNGGGKSTTFGLINGALEPDSGRVIVSALLLQRHDRVFLKMNLILRYVSFFKRLLPMPLRLSTGRMSVRSTTSILGSIPFLRWLI